MEAAASTYAEYDEVAYPTIVLPQMAPETLYATGLLNGWEAPRPETAAILELGCSDGINLLASAAAYPGCRAVGIDLSAAAIVRGQDLQRAAGLANVELVHGDILAMPLEGEKFDYILAHGLLTWVPLPVRDAIFRLLEARLKPGGVAYFGYDVLPANAAKVAITAYVRPLVTAMVEEPMAQVDAFAAIVRRLRQNQLEGSFLASAMDQMLQAAGKDRSHTYHDWLSPHYHPLSIDDLVALAAPHGLKFAGDASNLDRFVGDLDPEGLDVLVTAGNDPARRGTVLGLLRGMSTFRADLLVRADSPPPPAPPERYRTLRFKDMEQQEVPDNAGTLAAAGDARKAVLGYCYANASREVTAADVAAGTGLPPAKASEELLAMARMGLLNVFATAPGYTLAPGEQPRCSGLARAMLGRWDWTVTPRHRRVEVANPLIRRLLQLCDGTRTRAGLARQLSEDSGAEVSPENVDGALRAAAERSLLVG